MTSLACLKSWPQTTEAGPDLEPGFDRNLSLDSSKLSLSILYDKTSSVGAI